MQSSGKIIDISIRLNADTPIYPGNPKVEITHFASASGQSFNSQILLGTHVGTHIDAPAHAFADGIKIEDMPLTHFVGPVRVIDLTKSTHSISVEDLLSKSIQADERILLKTSNSVRGFRSFYDDYVFISPEAAEYLATKQVLLVGIDAFSVKQKGSPDNRPHTALLSKNIPIIEGLDLSKTNEGEYFLYAAPLACDTGDAAPTRAILIK